MAQLILIVQNFGVTTLISPFTSRSRWSLKFQGNRIIFDNIARQNKILNLFLTITAPQLDRFSPKTIGFYSKHVRISPENFSSIGPLFRELSWRQKFDHTYMYICLQESFFASFSYGVRFFHLPYGGENEKSEAKCIGPVYSFKNCSKKLFQTLGL